MLDKLALLVIAMLLLIVTAAIVWIGSLPGSIARSRNHPWPDAVNAASWIGLATGVLWPFAFVWAFLPVPMRSSSAATDGLNEDSKAASDKELTDVKKRIVELESAVKALQSQKKATTA